MTERDPWEPQAKDEAQTSAGPDPGESASGEREGTADLSLPDLIRRAIAAQGKVDPDVVFEEAENLDLDDLGWVHEMRDEDPGPDILPPDEQIELGVEDEMARPDWA